MRSLVGLVVLLVVVPISAQNSGAIAIRPQVRNAAAAPALLRFTAHRVDDANVVREIADGFLRAEPNSRWQVIVANDGWWSPIEEVTVPAAGTQSEHVMPLWRTGRVSGTVTVAEANDKLPPKITWMVDSPPQPKKEPEIRRGTEFNCPVDADGKWTCNLPATLLDLTLRAKGFTPHYRWDVAVAADKSLDLGQFALKRGASFVAWLDRDSAGLLKEPARASLLRPLSDAPSQTTARLREPVASATFNKRGAVQLTAVPAGTYLLEVRAKGFAAARIYPVEIYEGKESVFRKAILLQPPLTVRLTVDPPSDPSGARWRATWMKRSDFVSGYDLDVVVTTVGEDGALTLPDQSPGTFNINLQDHAGNKVWDEELRIHDDGDSRHHIRVEQFDVNGKVTLGGEPYEAKLLFGGRDGAVRSTMTSDADGRFAGYVPHRGRWPVEISGDGGVRTLLSVDVTTDDLKIELSDTSISGVVVGSDGKPVARADVSATLNGRVLSVASEADGRFAFRALPVGSVRLRASNRRAGETSMPVDIALTENQKITGVELHVDATKTVTGHATSGGTPVVGARINAYAMSSGHGEQKTAVTDTNGRFQLRLASVANDALLIAAVPGRTLQAMQVAIDDRPLEIEIAPVGGTVEVIANAPFRVTHDGALLPDVEMYSWIEAHGIAVPEGERLMVADLAPGHYRACSRAGKCKDGLLAPRGSLILDLR
ncbi:MAG: Carboxypeptidase regulatory-like domain [Acidobacteriota bacterium]|nr:Carboxypeptidase regulatory-like domain [Acidobacteriota bacterium]